MKGKFTVKKLLMTSTLAATLAVSGAAYAATLTQTIGDNDNMGGRLIGDQVTLGSFDNRSLAESSATNGAQHTDWSDGTFGITDDFQDFVFNFAPITGTITSVTLNIAIAGLQSNDQNNMTKNSGEDGLFIDGLLVDHAFEQVDQGDNDFDVVSIVLGAGLYASIMDGMTTARIDTNSFGGTMPGGGTSPVFYDYVQLVVEYDDAPPAIPLPAGLPLLLAGLGAFGLVRRRK